MGALRAREIINEPMLKLIVVESIDLRPRKTQIGWHCLGKMEPIAVIVCSLDGTYALDVDAQPADVERLRQDVPELDAMVSPSNKGSP